MCLNYFYGHSDGCATQRSNPESCFQMCFLVQIGKLWAFHYKRNLTQTLELILKVTLLLETNTGKSYLDL